MNILAAFFLIGLLVNGLKVIARYLLWNVQSFNPSESFILLDPGIESKNLLSATSNNTQRRDSNYIRITTSRTSNDRRKRLVFPPQPYERGFESGNTEIYSQSA